MLITGPTTGVVELQIGEMQVDYKTVESAGKGIRFSIPLDTVIRRSDKLYKVVEASEVKKQ